MITRLVFVFVFTFAIHLIGTLSYSVRLVGIKTGRIAVSFALFNILMLVSRTANSFQAPLLAKVVERDLPISGLEHPMVIFNILILAASMGSLLGAFLIPTFQNILATLVWRFNVDRSVPRIILHAFSKNGVKQLRDKFRAPSKQNLDHFKDLRRMPKRLLLLNMIVVGVLTIGSFSALYAAFLNPELRLTSSTLVPIITGFATVMLVIFIDPFFSLLTDDCIEGKVSVGYFHKSVVLMVASRFAGTVLAQLFLFPAAHVILYIAKII
jgi:hypothetical protein